MWMKVAERKRAFDSIRVIDQVHAEASVIDAAAEHHAVRGDGDYAAAGLNHGGVCGGRHITGFQLHLFVHVMKQKSGRLDDKQRANKSSGGRQEEGSAFQLRAEQEDYSEAETEQGEHYGDVG